MAAQLSRRSWRCTRWTTPSSGWGPPLLQSRVNRLQHVHFYDLRYRNIGQLLVILPTACHPCPAVELSFPRRCMGPATHQNMSNEGCFISSANGQSNCQLVPTVPNCHPHRSSSHTCAQRTWGARETAHHVSPFRIWPSCAIQIIGPLAAWLAATTCVPCPVSCSQPFPGSGLQSRWLGSLSI